MSPFLEILTGEARGRRCTLVVGRTYRVGRVAPAEIQVLDDPMLSSLHFQITWDGTACVMTDLGTRYGTQVNGVVAKECTLKPGDTLAAGRTTFRMGLEGQSVAAPASSPAASAGPATELDDEKQLVAAVLHRLWTTAQPLFFLLDAAKDPMLAADLKASSESFASLYEGQEGAYLDDFAPYLVQAQKDSPFLAGQVRGGWGNGWNVFCTSASPFAELRKHFRRFLMVRLEGGEQVYFRYYDPEVLRRFLPTCTPAELREFFGPVERFYVEGFERTQLLSFVMADGRLKQETVTLAH